MKNITTQFAALLAWLLVGGGCGEEKIDGRLSIEFLATCEPGLGDLADQIDAYCILVEYSDGRETTENCASVLEVVKLKVDASDDPVRVVVEGRGGNGEVVVRGRSVPVVLTSGEDLTLEIPVAPAREFGLLAADQSGCQALPFPVVGHTATVFPSGHVLVAGSKHPEVPSSAAAFLIDPVNASMDTLPTPESLHRGDHTATLMEDGEVVVIGGLSPDGQVREKSVMLRNTADLMKDYDREKDYQGLIFFDELAAGLVHPRGVHDASLFQGDRVLMNDGQSTAEMFVGFTELSDTIRIAGDPANNPFPLNNGRIVTTVPLDRERAVILGGEVNHNGMIFVSEDSLEVEFAPFNLQSGMRNHPRGVLLPDNQVLFVGGGVGALVLRQPAVVVDPAGPSLTAVQVQEGTFPVHSFSVSALPDGRVVVAGGQRDIPGSQFVPGSSFIIEPRGDSPAEWAVLNGPGLKMPRAGHTASVLPDNRLLLIGGFSADPDVSHEAVAYSAEIIAF